MPSREYYAAHKEKWAAYYKANRARFRAEREEKRSVLNWLKSQPCPDCRATFPAVCMDFDHVRGVKAVEPAQLSLRAWPSILQELAKCEVVCSNCHRLRTWHRMFDA